MRLAGRAGERGTGIGEGQLGAAKPHSEWRSPERPFPITVRNLPIPEIRSEGRTDGSNTREGDRP